jgi:hypothetical protein
MPHKDLPLTAEDDSAVNGRTRPTSIWRRQKNYSKYHLIPPTTHPVMAIIAITSIKFEITEIKIPVESEIVPIMHSPAPIIIIESHVG